MSTPVLNYLSEVLSENSKSGNENIFKNDFSKIVYIVNNNQRKQQLEYVIFNEMKNSGIESIIPPKIMTYKLAFLLQAAKYLLTNYNPDDITEYSEDWAQFLMYEIAEELLKDNKEIENDEYRRKENVERNLARELSKYIGYIVMNLKEEKVKEFNNTDNDPVINWFKKAIERYNEKVKEWMEKNSSLSKQKFYNPLSAYKLLYNEVTKDGFTPKNDEVLLIEDFESMEPIFQEIAEKIGCKGVEKKPDEQNSNSTNKKPQLYEFMTSFDEVESICFKIKQLLDKNSDLSSHQILIVPCNPTTAEMLTLTLQRFGLSHITTQTIGSSEEYSLLTTYYKIKTNQFDGGYHKLRQLLESEISNCKITQDVDVHSLLAKQGSRFASEPLKVIKEIYEKLTPEQKQNSPYREFQEHFLTTTDSMNAVDALKIIRYEYPDNYKGYKPQPALMNTLVEMCLEIDRLIKPTEGNSKDELKNKAKKVLLLMDLAARREYYVYSKKSEDEINHFIPVISPEKAHTIPAKYIFVCGLNASFDKREVVPGPYTLLEGCGCELPEDKKKRIIENIDTALRNAENSFVSYAYLGLESRDVQGISNYIREKKDKEEFNLENSKNNDGSLLKITDFIKLESNNNKVPEKSYSYIFETQNSEQKTENNIPTVSSKPKIVDFLKDKEGQIKVSVTNLVTYFECPRKFVLDLLAEKSGVKKIDPFEEIRLNEGIFWHKVFSEVFNKDKEKFNSTNENEIYEVLKNTFNSVGKDEEISKFANDIKKYKDDADIRLKRFAKQEKGRRDIGLKTVAVELPIFKEFTHQNIAITLEGKIDRIDQKKGNQNDKIILWDYKIKSKDDKTISIFVDRDNEKFFRSKDMAQLGIYAYLYNENAHIGIISYTSGEHFPKDTTSQRNWDRWPVLLVDGQNNDVSKIKAYIGEFIEFISKEVNEGIKIIESKIQRKDNNKPTKEYSGCDYCDFKEICILDYIEDKGGENGN